MKRRSWLFVIMVLFFASSAFAGHGNKFGSAGFKFLTLGAGARAAGLGNSAVTLTSDAYAAYWNAAALSRVGEFNAQASVTQWFIDTDYITGAVAYRFRDIGVVAVSFQYFSYGDLEETAFVDQSGRAIPGNRTGRTFSPSDLAIGLSYVRELTSQLSLGGTVKLVREDLTGGEETGTGVAFDVGVLFDTRYEGIRLGAAVTNFGPDISFSDVENAEKTRLPTSFRAAVSTERKLSDQVALNGSFELLKRNDAEQEFIPAVELMFMDVLSIRGGYNLTGENGRVGFGGGLAFKGIRVDYGFNHFSGLEDVHTISVGFGLMK